MIKEIQVVWIHYEIHLFHFFMTWKTYLDFSFSSRKPIFSFLQHSKTGLCKLRRILHSLLSAWCSVCPLSFNFSFCSSLPSILTSLIKPVLTKCICMLICAAKTRSVIMHILVQVTATYCLLLGEIPFRMKS